MRTQDNYQADCHRMQSAIAAEISALGYNAAGADGKHLRVGINSAMSDAGALVKLLISKGVFTAAEYEQAVFEAMQEEADRACDRTRRKLGLPSSVNFL